MPVYTPLPEHPGERRLAEDLCALDDGKLHLWFGIAGLPGVREIDVLLLHEEAGLFVIEVKAVPLELLYRVSPHECGIQDRDGTEHPVLQARAASIGLRTYLQRGWPDLPYVAFTACWPRIHRSDWDAAWDLQTVTGDYSRTMLFGEDLFSGPEALVNRLKHIRRHPPAGKGSEIEDRDLGRAADRLNHCLQLEARRRPTSTQQERLRNFQSALAQETLHLAPTAGGDRLVFSGPPGTGKTWRLLQIGVAHAQAGRSVAFFCYNQALGADVRRFLADRASSVWIDAVDVYEWLERGADAFGLEPLGETDHEAWAARTLEALCGRRAEIGRYQTVLVDEAQDMPAWVEAMLDLACEQGATLVLADGEGQELYGGRAEWVGRFALQARVERLRRNWRNPEQVMRLADLAHRTELRLDRLESVVKNRRSADQPSLDFELPGGQLPQIRMLPAVSGGGLTAVADLRNAWIDGVARQIGEALEDLGAEGSPIDLLVLVPSARRSEWDEIAREALRLLGVPCFDLTEPSRRREDPPTDAVRLCTWHSSRGLEARIVLLLGLDSLETVIPHAGTRTALAYIALSRATRSARILLPQDAVTPPALWVRRAVAALGS